MIHCHNVYHAEAGMMTLLGYLRLARPARSGVAARRAVEVPPGPMAAPLAVMCGS